MLKWSHWKEILTAVGISFIFTILYIVITKKPEEAEYVFTISLVAITLGNTVRLKKELSIFKEAALTSADPAIAGQIKKRMEELER